MKKDLVSIADLTAQEIKEIFKMANSVKKNPAGFSQSLAGKTLALIFQKPSCRTRVSFEVGTYQLGGNSIYLGPEEINLGVRESVKDVAKTLSRYIDAIVLRTFEHKNVLEMAQYASVPVINGLSDFSHPCQALADLFTVEEKLGNLKGKVLAYIGDGNNVCNSLLFTCAKLGVNMSVATPSGYEPDKGAFTVAQKIAQGQGAWVRLFDQPFKAAQNADVLYTDVWASMGQEKEAEKRKKIFKGFQINKKLVNSAKKNVLIMHCLPAHRGQEITEEVLDSKNSIIFDQAENRMHLQKAILIKLLARK